MNTTWRKCAAASALALCVTPALADDDEGNFAMAFRTPASGPGAIAATAPGSPVTLQTDFLRMEALVKWDGPPNRGGLIVYNGHGCCSGWGILLLGDNDGPAFAHKLSVLAGGITVGVAEVTLPVGVWTQVAMERRGQVVTLTLRGTGKKDPTQTFDLGIIPVNPLGVDNRPVGGGQTVRTTEKLTIGENFNGIIDDVKIRTLDTKQTVESFRFNKVTGFTAVGKNGAALDLQSANWIGIPGDDHDDD